MLLLNKILHDLDVRSPNWCRSSSINDLSHSLERITRWSKSDVTLTGSFFSSLGRLAKIARKQCYNVIESSVFSPATLWPFDTVHIDMFSKCHWPNDRTPSNQPVQNLDQKKTKKTHTHDQADMSCYSRTLLAIGVSMNRLKNVNPLLMAYSCGVLKQAYQSISIHYQCCVDSCSMQLGCTDVWASWIPPATPHQYHENLVPTGTKLSGLIRGS